METLPLSVGHSRLPKVGAAESGRGGVGTGICLRRLELGIYYLSVLQYGWWQVLGRHILLVNMGLEMDLRWHGLKEKRLYVGDRLVLWCLRRGLGQERLELRLRWWLLPLVNDEYASRLGI